MSIHNSYNYNRMIEYIKLWSNLSKEEGNYDDTRNN